MMHRKPQTSGAQVSVAPSAAPISSIPLPALHRLGLVLWLAARRFRRDNCLQAAGALTYAGLLAVVPLLTVTFAAFSAFPAFERMRTEAEMLILQNVVPRVGADLDRYLQSFINNAGALTGVGVVGLGVTSILLFFSVERAYNQIWQTANRRALMVRLLSFWAMLTLAPLLFAAGLSASSGLLMELGVAHASVLVVVRKVLPGVCEFLLITLSYVVLPKRSVAWRDAAIGGAVASFLLEVTRVIFHDYFGNASTYTTIYGALSVLPTLLVWIWLVWSIVLYGAELTATLPESRSDLMSGIGPGGLTPAQRLMVALTLLRELMLASREGRTLVQRDLDRRLAVGPVDVDGVLDLLGRTGWIVRTADGAWALLRDPHTASINDLVECLGLGLPATLSPVAMASAGTGSALWHERLETVFSSLVAERSRRLTIPLADLLTGE